MPHSAGAIYNSFLSCGEILDWSCGDVEIGNVDMWRGKTVEICKDVFCFSVRSVLVLFTLFYRQICFLAILK